MIDAEITFRKLEIFLCYMQEETISRAANQLGISSVSVHRALHSLEEGMRCPLFTHKGRNLVPLPQAYRLADHAKEVLSKMHQGIDETRQLAGIGQGRIRIGTLYSLTLDTVPQLLMGLKLRRSELEVDLTMGSNNDLLHQLEHQKLHAILISVTDSDVDLHQYEVLPLFEDEIFLAAPKQSTLSDRRSVDLRSLKNEHFVSLNEGFATYHGFQEAFKIAGFAPKIVTRVNDIFSMVNLVQAGVGYTLLPGRLIRAYRDSIRILPLSDDYQMRQTIALVYAHNQELDPNLLALVAEGRMYARRRAEEISGE
ncbi:LysR family transcriptional regulator [Celerinatantimonas sp. MCCC 1A17872]|uniref:LysR family transcriptional regulator n=1 Tax=Celerinatantimonas sp. MCCC 1A17872 TaxID=3177514 RepID=UPI0038C3816D